MCPLPPITQSLTPFECSDIAGRSSSFESSVVCELSTLGSTADNSRCLFLSRIWFIVSSIERVSSLFRLGTEDKTKQNQFTARYLLLYKFKYIMIKNEGY